MKNKTLKPIIMSWTKRAVEELAYSVVGCAIEVHREMGPGLLESVYEECMVEELRMKGIEAESQRAVPLFYKGRQLKKHLRADLLVEDCLLLELKACKELEPVFEAQLLSYLKHLNKPKGLIINFNVTNIVKEGLLARVSELYRLLPDE